MGYRISTPVNVMLFKAREVPLRLRFNYLTRKYLTKCFSRDFNPVIESLNSLRVAALGSALRIKLLISLPIFKQFICLLHYRNIVYRSPFLPFHFFDLVALLMIRPCLDMHPVDHNRSQSEIINTFLEKSSNFRKNTISFYTDGSKLDKDSPSGAPVFSSDLNHYIAHKLPPESSVFSTEAWAILQAVNASLDFNCSKSVIFSDYSKSVLDALSSPLPPNKNYIIYRIKKRLADAFKDNKEIILF